MFLVRNDTRDVGNVDTLQYLGCVVRILELPDKQTRKTTVPFCANEMYPQFAGKTMLYYLVTKIIKIWRFCIILF